MRILALYTIHPLQNCCMSIDIGWPNALDSLKLLLTDSPLLPTVKFCTLHNEFEPWGLWCKYLAPQCNTGDAALHIVFYGAREESILLLSFQQIKTEDKWHLFESQCSRPFQIYCGQSFKYMQCCNRSVITVLLFIGLHTKDEPAFFV